MAEWQSIPRKLQRCLNAVAGVFLPKAGEVIAGTVIDTGKSIVEFQTKLQDLKRNSKRLKDAASDIKTEVESKELRGRKKRKREVGEWLDGEAEIHRDIQEFLKEVQEKGKISHFTCFDLVGKLNKRVEKHIEQSRHFHELVLDDHGQRDEKLLTSKMYGAAFQSNLKQIFNWLDDDEVQIVGIHGKPGLGKTALAKHIHNLLLERTLDRVYWVSASENSSIQTLQDDIFRAIGIAVLDEKNVDKRAARLNHALKQKQRFVLILDNLREGISLETVGYPYGEDGCRLIITTRSSRVCYRSDCQKSLEVKMNEDDAWNMFKEAYGQGPILTSQCEEYAKLEVNKHLDFPERIIELAKTMKGMNIQPDSPEWQYQLAEMGVSFERGG